MYLLLKQLINHHVMILSCCLLFINSRQLGVFPCVLLRCNYDLPVMDCCLGQRGSDRPSE